MPNWKGKEYPYTAKGIAAYWAARGKDEGYKRKKVKAKTPKAKPKPSNVKRERVFSDDDFAKARPYDAATVDVYRGGMEEEALKMVASPESRNLSTLPVTGMPEEPPPPKDKRTSWDKRKRTSKRKTTTTPPTTTTTTTPTTSRKEKKTVEQFAEDVRGAFNPTSIAKGVKGAGKALKAEAKRKGEGKTKWDKKKKATTTADLKEEMLDVQRKRKKKY